MRKNWPGIGSVAAIAVVFCALGAWAQGKHPTRDFMRQKVTYTQGIVEGLVTEKYGMVVTNATALRNMNLTNAFLALKNPSYVDGMTNFQGKVDELIKAANGKDLERSTDAYSQVVNSCVSCHKTFRREQFQETVNSEHTH
jgi:hypothetical protein